jgi:glycosyltransferase involved in cell wall biosynthesis
MKFSIITVCFNAAGSITRTMDSLAQQSCKDYEWIVVDGASTDATLAIVAGFSAAPKILISERDGGIYDAMNKGIACARGEYLFFLNSDDEFASADVLNQVAGELVRHQMPALMAGRITYSSARKRELRDYQHISYARLFIDSLCHQAVFCRRDLFSQFGLFDLQYKMCADYDWFLRVLRGGVKLECTKTLVSVFSGDGAHVQQAQRTAAELEAIRLAYLGRVKYRLVTIWRYLHHYIRKGFGLNPSGCTPLP